MCASTSQPQYYSRDISKRIVVFSQGGNPRSDLVTYTNIHAHKHNQMLILVGVIDVCIVLNNLLLYAMCHITAEMPLNPPEPYFGTQLFRSESVLQPRKTSQGVIYTVATFMNSTKCVTGEKTPRRVGLRDSSQALPPRHIHPSLPEGIPRSKPQPAEPSTQLESHGVGHARLKQAPAEHAGGVKPRGFLAN